MAKKLRNFMVEDDLMRKVKTKAASLGITVTKLLTDFLTQWVK